MRKLLLSSTAVLALWGCSDSTAPKVATSVAIVPGSLSFDAVGAKQVVHGTVLDQKGNPMSGQAVAWSAGSGAVNVAGLGGDSALVTAASNGTTTVSASSGAAAGSVQATVAQVPTQIQKTGGDQQAGTISGALAAPIAVKVMDRLGAGVPGVTVSFAVTTGGGGASAATAVTDAEGRAAINWTLGGSQGAQSLTVAVPGAPALAPAVFTATAVAQNVGGVFPTRIDDVAGMVNADLTPTPAVVVRNNVGVPLAGVSVTFAVASGGGSVTGATVLTNASGVATLGRWRLGSAGINTVTATVNGAGFTNNPVTFRAIGCQGGGGAGYGITLCFTTPMTASQRQTFETAAARWAQLITGDIPDVPVNLDANACSDETPSLNLNVDDLVIFASVPDIDGPGAILGQAGWCLRRSGGLPLVGVMEFDAADVATLETREQFGSVILHEMGHVLGIGTLWGSFGLLQSPSSSGNVLDTYYTGAGGLLGFNNIGGSTYTGGQKVPVENTGGSGTANAHWRESVQKNELMTGFLNLGSNPLSELTVRSLGDLGYAVNPALADPFFLTLTLRGNVTGTGSSLLNLGDDLYHGPRYTVDRSGRRTDVPSQ
ncbi:MAG TPA: leishmanolysin-related zinc metalloendopeptidase [Longimicrobium sp.]|nr:leishmanolysin-related zinc metalloendopeptidase [Longimicrobium sp.]